MNVCIFEPVQGQTLCKDDEKEIFICEPEQGSILSKENDEKEDCVEDLHKDLRT